VRWLRRLAVAVAVIVFAVVIYAVTVLSIKTARRRRRSRGEPALRIAGAWAEALDRLDEAGMLFRPGATPYEMAARARQDRAALGSPMNDLAALHTRATYAPLPPEVGDADHAWSAVAGLVDALDQDDPLSVRWRRRLDPGLRRRSRERADLVDAVK